MLLIIIGFLCGIVLGGRFDFLILIPAILLGVILAALGGIATGASFSSIMLEVVLVTAALQVGYIGGIVAQWATRSKLALSKTLAEKSSTAPDGAF